VFYVNCLEQVLQNYGALRYLTPIRLPLHLGAFIGVRKTCDSSISMDGRKRAYDNVFGTAFS
jgi:hypothetical protein